MDSPSRFPRPVVLRSADAGYPPALRKAWSTVAYPRLALIGSSDLLLRQSVGLICSRRCPGSVVVRMYEFAQRLKLHDCVVVGGFQSPMERECLEILIRGRASIVLCPARGLGVMRLPRMFADLIREGRMTIVSPFSGDVRRATQRLAAIRNRFVAALSTAVIVPHAAHGSGTEAITRDLLALARPVYTCDDPANNCLLDLGAHRLEDSTMQPGHLPFSRDVEH